MGTGAVVSQFNLFDPPKPKFPRPDPPKPKAPKAPSPPLLIPKAPMTPPYQANSPTSQAAARSRRKNLTLHGGEGLPDRPNLGRESPRLAFLMDQHDLRQCDLPEVGAQSVVSAVLAGKRALNLRQTAALARRFGVPVDALI